MRSESWTWGDGLDNYVQGSCFRDNPEYVALSTKERTRKNIVKNKSVTKRRLSK